MKKNLYSINGKDIWLLTISDVAKLVGFKSKTLRKWEKNGILPAPAVVSPMYSPIVGECERRLYTEEQARVLADWITRVRPGRGVVLTEALVKLLHEKWAEVTQQFKNNLGGE